MFCHTRKSATSQIVLFAAATWLALPGGAPLAQVPTPAQPGQAEIRGTVRAADTGLPLRNAEVRLSGGPLKSLRSAFSDDAGRYRLADVAPGRYLLAASKLGYSKAGYGENAPAGEAKPLVTEGSLPVEDIDFRLIRAGVIIANITDPAGEPVAGAIVNVYRASRQGENRKLAYVESNGFMAHTDDRGHVRLFNLPPGSYYVAARMFPNPHLTGQPRTAEVFYPGTLSDTAAQPIVVASGQEVQATFYFVDARLARLTGTVLTSGGTPYPNPNVQLLSVTTAGFATFSISASGAGRFVAPEVPPGRYLIQVRPGAASPDEYATHEIELMGDDVEDLVVQTMAPSAIQGRIALDEPELGPKRFSDVFRLAPKFVGNTTSRGQVALAPDGTFEISGILGRGTLIVEDRTNTWFLESIESGGRDLSDQILDFKAFDGRSVELRLTRRPATIMGTAVGRDDVPAQEYVVVAFSEDRERWREPTRYVMTARPDQHGQFKLAGLQPGTYHVAALSEIEDGKEFDPQFLESLRAVSTRLTLERHASIAVSLPLVRSPQ